MSEGPNFLASAMTGDVLLNEIDDFVERWHDSDSGKELGEYLGMTNEEYSLWLTDPSMLPIICAARKRKQNIFEAVNDNLPTLKLAARTGEYSSLAMLEVWLKHTGRID